MVSKSIKNFQKKINLSKVILIDELTHERIIKVREGENVTLVVMLVEEGKKEGKIKVLITGENAKVNILGIILAQGDDCINLYTLQDHLKGKSVSDLLIKTALFGKSRLNYQGLIRIEKDAQSSNAFQKNQNLLLSKDAYANSQPNLEILANEVRCTHAATVSKIDEEQLYYLSTRGITREKSTYLILEGFFHEIFERIPDEKMKNMLEKRYNKFIHNIS